MIARSRKLAAALAVAVLPVMPGLHARQEATGAGAQLSALVADYMSRASAAAGGGLARGLSPDRMPDLSLALRREQAAAALAMLTKLKAIPTSGLSHDEWLTWSVLEFELRAAAESEACYWLASPITPYSSPLRGLTFPFSTFVFRSAADIDVYLDALYQVPVVIAAYQAKLRSQLLRGIVLPA